MMSESNHSLDHLCLVDDGVPIIVPVLELVVILTGLQAEVREACNRLYRDFLGRFSSKFQLWQSNAMHQMEPTDLDSLSLLSDWLSDDRRENEAAVFGVHLQAGAPQESATPPSFDFLSHRLDPSSPKVGIRLALPTNYLDGNAERLMNFVRESLHGLPVLYGFFGYALNWNAEFPSVSSRFVEWALPKLKRHPGLSHGDFLPYVLHAGAGLLGIAWLTLLGRAYTERLGGVERVLEFGDENCVVHRLGDDGVLIRAGGSPQLGDVNRRDLLPAYNAVGRLVQPLAVEEDVIERLNLMVLRGQEKKDWLLRFFSRASG